MKFYRCTHCEQIFMKLIDEGKTMTCCEEEVILLEENALHSESRDHDPNIRKVGNFVTISMKHEHPMIDIHYINFICMETNQGFHYKDAKGQENAIANFVLAKDEQIKNVYIYCNLHSLWSVNKEMN